MKRSLRPGNTARQANDMLLLLLLGRASWDAVVRIPYGSVRTDCL
jgi:hypothetical protein